MYEVKIAEEVHEKVLTHFRSKIMKREGWRLPVAEQVEISTYEVWEKLIANLQTEPTSYFKLRDGIYLAIELYLPFIVAFAISNDVVLIHKAYTLEELFM